MKRAMRLAGGVSLGLRRAGGERRVVVAADELQREDTPRRERVDDPRNDDVRVVLVHPSKGVGGVGLEAVVDLGEEDGANLVERLFGLIAPADGRDHRLEKREALQVVLDRLVDARVLHLHGDALAGARDGAVHLADAGGGERLGLPLEEDFVRLAAELFADDAAGGARRERRRLLLEALEDALELLLVSGRREAVDVRSHLPELEGQALHLAERLEHRVGGLLGVRDEPAARLDFFLLAAPSERGAPHGLGGHRQRARRERTEARQAAQARRRRSIGPIGGGAAGRLGGAHGRAVEARRPGTAVGRRRGAARRTTLGGRRRHTAIMRMLASEDHLHVSPQIFRGLRAQGFEVRGRSSVFVSVSRRAGSRSRSSRATGQHGQNAQHKQ